MTQAPNETPSVLMVTARFAPLVGGVETHVREVADVIGARGGVVEVLTTDATGQLPRLETGRGYSVHRVAAYPRRGDLYFAPKVMSHVRRSRADIVHLQGIHTFVAPLAMIAALSARKRLVVTFHTGGHRSTLRHRLRAVQWRLLAPLLRRADALIAVSDFERRLFARAARIDPARIRVIRNGSAMPALAAPPEEDPDLVVSVGRLEEYKGHRRAVAAMPHLLAARPRARLLILGSGPDRKPLERQVAELSLHDRVTIRAVPAEDRSGMARAMAEAALVVLLSDYEAHPIAVTEARALGRRVLVADTSGLSELAANGEASAVAIGALPAELAARMHEVMSLPAPPRAVALGWDQCVDQLIDVYRSVVRGS